MAIVRPFRALRPEPKFASQVAALPYDVVDTEEARVLVEGNPHSFLRVTRAEVELADEMDPYSDEVYAQGKSKLQSYQEQGVMRRDEAPCFYVYQIVMGEHTQTGFVGLSSCVEYDQGIVRKHEFTRPDKEADRVKHIETLGAQTGPVLMTYRSHPALDAVLEKVCQQEAMVDFEAVDGIHHRCWKVSDAATLQTIESLFREHVELLYIADGHHRSAAASLVAQARREADPSLSPEDPSQFFLSVIFPHDQVQILPYNRIVHDLNGLSVEAFWERVDQLFERELLTEIPALSPPSPRCFDMLFQEKWYRLHLKKEVAMPKDPVGQLDVSLLQDLFLAPVLGVQDPRRDKRISFVGGIRGYKGLEALAKRHPEGIALACYATSVEQLLEVADANSIMPPKSTWFEPKLRSGLFVHLLS
ncbi:MAG: DUF1015 domain-containing protein [Myxococcales bacterium]|nr:DUF1015 domain-containing protein [Myxococcales bacterium]